MSLESNIAELTAAVARLTTVLVSASESGAISAPAAAATPAATPAATRTKKSTAAAATPDATPGADPVGTRYFHIPAHNTVYKQLPGGADCTVGGALIVSADEYLRVQAEIAKKFASAAVVSTPQAATTEPIATAPAVTASVTAPAAEGVTFEQVIAKMRQLHAAMGNPGILSVLGKYGVAGVPMLEGKAPNNVLISEIDAVMVGL